MRPGNVRSLTTQRSALPSGLGFTQKVLKASATGTRMDSPPVVNWRLAPVIDIDARSTTGSLRRRGRGLLKCIPVWDHVLSAFNQQLASFASLRPVSQVEPVISVGAV